MPSIVKCPNCGLRVIPMIDGRCPQCRADTATGEDGTPRSKPEDSAAAQTRVAVIPAWGPERLWISVGVVIGGIAVGVAMARETDIEPELALIGGIASACAFLFCFDRSGSWRWISVIPAVLLALLIARGPHVPVLGGVAGYLF